MMLGPIFWMKGILVSSVAREKLQSVVDARVEYENGSNQKWREIGPRSLGTFVFSFSFSQVM